MYMLPVNVSTLYLCKFLILTVLLFMAITLQNLALAKSASQSYPGGTFELHTLIAFAIYSFVTAMPVLSFMLFIASRFENMWLSLGIGVAGFLSGMALGVSNTSLFLADPFVIMLKPAVSMSTRPDVSVIAIAIVETLLFLAAGLWTAANIHYE